MTETEKLPKLSGDQREALRAPFPDEAYKAVESKEYLTTLKAMYVTERLNDVFGLGRWTIEFDVVERTEDYVLGRGEFISLDYDVIVPKQFGGHKTTGKGVEIADGYKSALTDCQSKIASYLEIGIDMFKGKIKASSTSKPNSKYTFGSPKDEKIPWVQDGQVNAMIKEIPTDKQRVLDSLKLYRWSKANKERIINALEGK